MSPLLARSLHQRRVGWFELFYDLVIVAAVYYFGHSLIATPTWAMGLWIAVTATVTFILWLLTSLSINVFPVDDQRRRLLILVQMIALVLAALSSGSEEGLSNTTGFVALAVALGSVGAVYLLAASESTRARGVARLLAVSCGAGAAILLVGAAASPDTRWFVAAPAPWLLGIGVAVVAVPLFGPALGSLTRTHAIDHEHLGERLGQLVIIVLGESFISLVAALSDEAVIPNPVYLVLTFVVVYSIWAVYFSSVLPAGVPHRVGRLRAWVLVHLPLLFGTITAAAGFAALASTDLGVPDPGVKDWTAIPLLGVLLAITVLTWLAPARHPRLIPLHLAASAVLAILVVVGALVTDGGTNWELAVGSVVVMADAVLSTRIVRPYSPAATADATPASGSGPSPS